MIDMELLDRKLIIVIISIIGVIFLMTGCWNYKEVDEFNIVTGAAIDYEEEADQYILTVEVINQSVKDKSMEPVYFESKGKTIFEAIRNLIIKSGKRLYWGHAKAMIISRQIAEKDIIPAIDMIYRDAEMRSDMFVLISRDKTAREVLEIESNKIHMVTSIELIQTLDNNEVNSKYYPVPLWRFVKSLYSEGDSSTLPTVKIIENDKVLEIKVYGAAVFKKNKMVGWLNEVETRNYTWIINKLNGGVLVKSGFDNKNIDIALEIMNNKTKLTPIYKEGNFKMLIEVKTEFNISEIGGTINFIDEKGVKILEEDTEKYIKEELENLIKKVQKEYSSDIFSFGTEVKKKYPKVWDEVKNDWEEVFKNMNVEADVEVVIVGSALSSKPIKISK